MTMKYSVGQRVICTAVRFTHLESHLYDTGVIEKCFIVEEEDDGYSIREGYVEYWVNFGPTGMWLNEKDLVLEGTLQHTRLTSLTEITL